MNVMILASIERMARMQSEVPAQYALEGLVSGYDGDGLLPALVAVSTLALSGHLT